MPKIKYVSKKLNEKKLSMIEQANKIIIEYQKQGYELTLRQLYYQFVSRDLIANTVRSYKNLGNVVNDGRLVGLIDWDAIVDRTRNLQGNSHWTGPRSIVEACAEQYQIDKWIGQERRVEVWIEKDALVGVIERACRDNDVSFFSCRGYTSQSEVWAAGMRLKKYIKNGQDPVVIHLGDHDPSGKDMTRDIEDRLRLFTGGRVEVNRIALNMDQVAKYNPPPNPAKTTDARYETYRAEYGEDSWELDALEPQVIEKLIAKTIRSYRDDEIFQERVAEENEHKEQLLEAAERL